MKKNEKKNKKLRKINNFFIKNKKILNYNKNKLEKNNKIYIY
jgi:hypothetical protein